jgi:hypothetical protein
MKLRLAFLITLGLILVAIYLSGNWITGPEWVRTWGGPGDDSCNSIALDQSGNLIISGNYQGPADLDPGPGVDMHSPATSQGGIFVSKLDPSGNYMWGQSLEAGKSVAVDSIGNVFVTGTFSSLIDFDPGPGYEMHTPVAGPSAFLLKLDAEGNFQWVRTWGGTDKSFNRAVNGNSVATDSLGNSYVAGNFITDAKFDPGPLGKEVKNHSSDLFLVKYTPDGTFVWVHTWEAGYTDDDSPKVAVDADGSCYIASTSSGYRGEDRSSDFDPSVTDFSKMLGGITIFLRRTQPDGSTDWEQSWQASSDDIPEICLGAEKDKDIYVFSGFRYKMNLCNNEYTANIGGDAFVAKITPSCELEWMRSWAMSPSELASLDGNGISVDRSGTVRVVGTKMGGIDFNPGPGISPADEESLSFMSAFDSSGKFLGVESFNAVNLLCTASDKFGSTYLGGAFYTTLDFNPGLGKDMHVPGGRSDAVLIKLRSKSKP